MRFFVVQYRPSGIKAGDDISISNINFHSIHSSMSELMAWIYRDIEKGWYKLSTIDIVEVDISEGELATALYGSVNGYRFDTCGKVISAYTLPLPD